MRPYKTGYSRDPGKNSLLQLIRPKILGFYPVTCGKITPKCNISSHNKRFYDKSSRLPKHLLKASFQPNGYFFTALGYRRRGDGVGDISVGYTEGYAWGNSGGNTGRGVGERALLKEMAKHGSTRTGYREGIVWGELARSQR